MRLLAFRVLRWLSCVVGDHRWYPISHYPSTYVIGDRCTICGHTYRYSDSLSQKFWAEMEKA